MTVERSSLIRQRLEVRPHMSEFVPPKVVHVRL
jgi:hypothetical protein